MAGTDSKYPADDVTKPPQRRSRWWIAVLTFVAGVAVGVLIVGFPDQEHAGSLGRSERSADEPVAGRKPECARRGQCPSQCRPACE